jgi:hypothetical protein
MKMTTLLKLTLCLLLFPALVLAGPVTMEKVKYGGWDNCVRLSNGEIELIVTTDVGPRVIRCGFINGQNLFHEFPADLGKKGGDEWRSYGGHRLWHAPEAMPRTYALDNSPVKYEWNGKSLQLYQAVEPTTGIMKEIEITLTPDNHVTLKHRLYNKNLWEIQLAAWCLTVMAQNGRAIFPQEPFRPHPEYLLPARPLVLWHYTDMSDPRWKWGKKYIQLSQDSKATTKQKVGLLDKQGWAAFVLGGDVFIKTFPFKENATYADYGCNAETFTNNEFIEVETLSPLTTLQPGSGVEHVEQWYLVKAQVASDEASIDTVLLPLVEQMEQWASHR